MGKKRTIVGYPLVPDLLGDLNLLQGFPETPADFDPNGQWTNTYRIMTCHGYREEGNEDIGLLRLSNPIQTTPSACRSIVKSSTMPTPGGAKGNLPIKKETSDGQNT